MLHWTGSLDVWLEVDILNKSLRENEEKYGFLFSFSSSRK